MIKVSVIVPVYNVEKYLKKCLDSILNQTLKDIEVICVDDGSTDSSLDILNSYNDERLKIITHENQGAAISRNVGIKLAKGEYISFIDSDDWLELDALEKLYINAKSNDSDMVLFNAIEIKPKNRTRNRIYLPVDENIDYNNFTFDYNYNKRLVMNGMFVIWSKIYKTSFLKENDLSFYNHKIFNDVQFHIESMIFAKKISYHPEILYNYNKLNETSLQTNKTSYNKRLTIFNIFNEVEEFLINNGYYDEFSLDFFEFKIRESKVNLDKTFDEFKEEFYEIMRNEFSNMRLTSNILNKLPLKHYKFYINVLINEKYSTYDVFNKFVNYANLSFINKQELSNEIKSFNEWGLNSDKRDESIIISLTSYPDRMYDIHYCLYSLLTQSLKPDYVILWLAIEQFPNKEKDIPKEVLQLKNHGLTIKWCSDLKSYKKIIPALKEFPNSYIVTADDDIFYPKDWLKTMWDEYQKYPNTIISSRTRKINFDINGKINKYRTWKFPKEKSSSYLNFFTGAGGTLYFPNALSKIIFDEELFLNLCPSGDDIWIWAMAVLNRTKITSIGNPLKNLTYINIARELGILDETTLWEINQSGQNDVQLKNVLENFPEILEIIDE